MLNVLSHNPNKKLFPRRTTAVALIAASALSLAGCSPSGAKGEGAYLQCVGSRPYTVEPGDTLNEVLLKTTAGTTRETVNDISAELGRTDEFRGPGELQTLEVAHWAEDTPKPELVAGEKIDIPEQCEN